MIINKAKTQESAEVIQIDKVQQAFTAGIEKGQDEDTIKLAMVTAGAKFSNVNKLYKRYSIEAGLDLSKADRDSQVAALLEGANLATKESFDANLERLVSEVAGMTPHRASLAIRRFAKKNEIEVFKAPKGTGSRSSFVAAFGNYLVDTSPFPTREQAEAWIQENGTANAKKRVQRHMAEWEVASRIVQKYS